MFSVLNDVKLTDRGPLLTAALIKPGPLRGPGQDGAVLGLAPVRLRGPVVGRVPVLVGDAEAGLVRPDALGRHVVDAQPDLLVGADALTDVVSELVVLGAGRGGPEDPSQGVAVLAGSVVPFLHRVGQETLAVDLYAFQTD